MCTELEEIEDLDRQIHTKVECRGRETERREDRDQGENWEQMQERETRESFIVSVVMTQCVSKLKPCGTYPVANMKSVK